MRKLFIFLLIVFTTELSAQAFHLLILADNKDPEVGYAAEKNMRNIEQSFSYIASVSTLPIHITKLASADNTLTRDHILKWIRNEHIKPDDIIILYYGGHGLRERESQSVWPSGAFLNEKRSMNIVEFSEITEKLFSKQASLCLVLMDCCHVLIPKNFQVTSESPTFDLKKFHNQISSDGIKKLFLKLRGFVIASSTSPTEVGWSTNLDMPNGTTLVDDALIDSTASLGFIFTKIFLNNLFYELQTPQPQWSNIFQNTKTAVRSETKKDLYNLSQKIIDEYHPPHTFQTPQYRIFLHKKKMSPHTYRKYLFKKCKPKEMQVKILALNEIEKTLENTDLHNSDIYLKNPSSEILPECLLLTKNTN